MNTQQLNTEFPFLRSIMCFSQQFSYLLIDLKYIHGAVKRADYILLCRPLRDENSPRDEEKPVEDILDDFLFPGERLSDLPPLERACLEEMGQSQEGALVEHLWRVRKNCARLERTTSFIPERIGDHLDGSEDYLVLVEYTEESINITIYKPPQGKEGFAPLVTEYKARA